MKRACYVTYCSKEKDDAPGLLPAARRYRTARIPAAATRAAEDGAEFRIFSGEFGLLSPEDPIPWYDHLLRPDEVPAMAARLAVSFAEFGRVIFLYWENDYIEPYLAAVERGARAAGAEFESRVIKRD